MKVKELIQELVNCPMDADICVVGTIDKEEVSDGLDYIPFSSEEFDVDYQASINWDVRKWVRLKLAKIEVIAF